MASTNDSQEIFNNLAAKFSQLLYGRSEGDRNLINKILDDFNTLNYRYIIITNNTKAVLLVNQFCNLIPPDDAFLVAKCCLILTNLITRQHITIEGRTLSMTIDWILQALKQAQEVVVIDILVALEALLRSNSAQIHLLLASVITQNGPILTLASKQTQAEIVLLAVQCVQAACAIPENQKGLDIEKFYVQHKMCAAIFFKYLLTERTNSFDEIIHAKLLITCLNGLQNIINQHDEFHQENLGLLLGVAKSYMVYQLKGINFLPPQKLLPSTLSIPEAFPNKPRERKGGKVTKQRKQRPSGAHKKEVNKDFSNNYKPVAMNLDVDEIAICVTKLKTSDSDFSDSEAGRSGKIGINEGRLRQAALNLLLNICKWTDKSTMFSYWSSFIPDAPLSGSHSLTNCILKDPSPRGRMAALNVLLALLASAKIYLSQAEYSERATSFTPFSAVLGSIIKELHHCLSLALNETSFPVLTQTLKCIGALVQATPYHRLAPGLTNKIIRNVKNFIYHKDSTVQVAALIVLGCILASDPPVKETKEAFLKNYASKTTENTNDVSVENFDYADFSSSDEECLDDADNLECTPWLLHKCLKNLNHDPPVPAPVKLESLQVISAMSLNYFEALISPHLGPITKALEVALVDKYLDVRLHAGHTVDFIGQAMNTQNFDHIDRTLAFWQSLLSNALITLVQCEQFPTLRSIGCDCIGSIGARAFEQLPRDKQILCITVLFSCSRDEDNTVKGSAVRALAISVLYPALREDPGFIMDTAEAIHRTLNDENMGLRVKSSWSLGNLSDALVLNKLDPNICEQIPDDYLLDLINDSIKACGDNDKIKSNAVRALGNLLQLIDAVENDTIRKVVDGAVKVLIKCATTGSNMKARWNSCYALGNVLKCVALYSLAWMSNVFAALGDLVVGFKNFKVRINAALALASCPTRQAYGSQFHFVWKALIKALENSENMEDFSEYKHRDHLVEQVCLSLGNLTTLLKAEDLPALKDSFSENALKTQMQRVYGRLLPEKSTILFSAQEHLISFKNVQGEQAELLNMLKNIFSNDLTY